MIRINLRNALLRSFATIFTLSLVFASGASAALSVICLSLAVIADIHVFYLKRNWAKRFHFGSLIRAFTHPWFPLALYIVFFLVMPLFFLVPSHEVKTEGQSASVLDISLGLFKGDFVARGENSNNLAAASNIAVLWSIFLLFFSILHARFIFSANSERASSAVPNWLWGQAGRKPYLSSDYLGDIILQCITLFVGHLFVVKLAFFWGVSMASFLTVIIITSVCLGAILIIAEYEVKLVGEKNDRLDE